MSQKPENNNVSNIGEFREQEFSGRVDTIQGGDNGNNGGTADGDKMGNEYVDLKLEAAKFELTAVMANFQREVSEKISHLPTKAFWVGTLLGVAALLYAALQISDTQFSSGYAASSAYARQLEEYRASTNARFDETNMRIDQTNVRLGNIEGLLMDIAEARQEGPETNEIQ